MNVLLPEQLLPRPFDMVDEEVFPYETSDFHDCWWRTLASKFDIRYRHNNILVRRKRFFKGLLTLNEARISGWHNAWSQDLTMDRAKDLIRMAQEAPWDYFRYTWNENREHYQLLGILKQLGYEVMHFPTSPQQVLDLSGGFEAYLKSLHAKVRSDIKQKLRRAHELRPILEPVSNASDIEPFFETFFTHHLAYWDEKAGRSYFHDPLEREFIVTWSKALYQYGQLSLSRLWLNGETANLSMSIMTEKTAYLVLTINTGRCLKAFPGLLSIILHAQNFSERGIQFCNLGGGDYSYKTHRANRRESCWETIVLNPNSMKARLYQKWLEYRYPEIRREA